MPPVFDPFRPLQEINSIAQCSNCGAVSSFDTLDVIIMADRTCNTCDGRLKLYWNYRLRQSQSIRG